MFRLFLCAAVAAFVPALSATAQQVLVSPTSVIFEDGQRSAQLVVGNTGDVTSLFTLEPAFFRMEPDGQRVEVKPPFPDDNAAELIRFSPRQFELAPGTSQIVRMATRIPDSVPPGEYRIHLRVTNKGEAQTEPQIDAVPGGNLTVAVRIEVSRAIRVIVRKGVTAGRASLANVTAAPAGAGRLAVLAELDRSGDGSSSGQYRIYTRDHAGAVREELVRQGVLVYRELSRRKVTESVQAGFVGSGLQLCFAYQDDMAPDGQEEERCVRPG